MAHPADKDGSKTPVMWKHLREMVTEIAKCTREHVAMKLKPLETRQESTDLLLADLAARIEALERKP
jgi:hypothetical protein